MPDGNLSFLPYGKQEISEADVKAVAEALCSGWLTTGPRVAEFEKTFASWCGAREGVAVNSGTAALHAAMRAVELKPGDEVIVPAITFAASANAAIYEGGVPVFADVERDTLLIDPASTAARITPKTRAIVAVDYAGQPADYDVLRALAQQHGLALIADACHSPGATYKGRSTGSLADISCFSFHPVKHSHDMRRGHGGHRQQLHGRPYAPVSQPWHRQRTIARAKKTARMPMTWLNSGLQLSLARRSMRPRSGATDATERLGGGAPTTGCAIRSDAGRRRDR